MAPDSQAPDTTPLYEEVELTAQEMEEGIREAKRKKFVATHTADYWARIKSSVDWSRPNARELLEALRGTKSQTGEYFKVTDWNKDVVFKLCLYFSGDVDKLASLYKDMDPNKGILICGKPGVGKTHLMSFFSKNPVQSYANITCSSIAERYRTGWKRDELDTLEWYSFPLKAEAGHVYGHTTLGYCFGDLGTEGVKKNYGNEMNVMEHIIFTRYENKLPFNMTHLTSNLNPEEIEQAYGPRIRDRLKEMCNYLYLDGPSFR